MFTSLEKALALRASTLFSGLSPDELLPVAAICTELRLGDKEVLFREEEMGDALYVIASGRLRVEQDGSLVAQLGTGDCVGEMAALDWGPRSATVVAQEPALLVRLGRNDLMDLLRDNPVLVRSLALVLVGRIRKAQS